LPGEAAVGSCTAYPERGGKFSHRLSGSGKPAQLLLANGSKIRFRRGARRSSPRCRHSSTTLPVYRRPDPQTDSYFVMSAVSQYATTSSETKF
jgi:hypothetical protein